MRYQEREVNKFLGENIPSKTFKYLQYITQEEQALMDQERRHRAQMQQQQPQVQQQQPPVIVSNVQSKPHQTRMYAPKPIMNPPISFQNSPLNKDRPKVNFTSNSTSYNARNINSYFNSPENNNNRSLTQPIYQSQPLQYQPQPQSLSQPQPNYPFSHEIKYETPKQNYSDFDNNPVFKQEQENIKESIDATEECTFLTSEPSFNETNITFNSISPDNNDQTHTQVIDVKTTGKILIIN